jgi:hypothetical protein
VELISIVRPISVWFVATMSMTEEFIFYASYTIAGLKGFFYLTTAGTSFTSLIELFFNVLIGLLTALFERQRTAMIKAISPMYTIPTTLMVIATKTVLPKGVSEVSSDF